MPSNSIALRLGGLPLLRFVFSIVELLSFTQSALADFSLSAPQTSGLGVSPTSIWYFRSLCGAKYNACYFCCAMAHIIRLNFSLCSGFRCLISELELCDLSLLCRIFRRSYSLKLLRDALNIIGVNILNWLGAVIAQYGRQFDETVCLDVLNVDFLVVTFRLNYYCFFQ